jgi:hypothetical protein
MIGKYLLLHLIRSNGLQKPGNFLLHRERSGLLAPPPTRSASEPPPAPNWDCRIDMDAQPPVQRYQRFTVASLVLLVLLLMVVVVAVMRRRRRGGDE